MVEVKDVYKLLDVEDKGVCRVVTKDAWNVAEVITDKGIEKINDGDYISFVVEDTGEQKTGIVKKISGKGGKTKITFVPDGEQHEETWSLGLMKSGSLVLK